MKKNLVKKAVLPVFVALLCSVIALTSVSYAWFTMGNTASVGEMELEITSSTGLQVSASGSAGTYKSIITLDDLKYDGNTNVFPEKASPISSVGTVKAGKQEMFLGTIDDNGALKSEVTENNYICFDLYIQTSNDYTLLLDIGSYVISTNEAKKAARVSFVNLGNGPTAAAAKVLTGGDGTAVIWEPNFKERTQHVLDNEVAANTDSALPYYGLKAAFEATALTEINKAQSTVSSKPTVITPAYGQDGKTTATAELLSLKAGYNKIRVYVWLEGQDVDCVDAIAAGVLKVQLNFALPTQQ